MKFNFRRPSDVFVAGARLTLKITMAFDPDRPQQPPLWSSQPHSHLDSQVGGLFYNLESQDAHLDFHEPAQVRSTSAP